MCTQKFDLSLILLSQSLKLFVADEQSGRHADIVLHDGKNSYKKKNRLEVVCASGGGRSATNGWCWLKIFGV